MAHNVQVNANQTNVSLPNGIVYTTGGTPVTVLLTDEQFDELSTTVFTNNILDDLGATPDNDLVTTQATHVAAVAALTSSQNATAAGSDPATTQALANALKDNYNQLQADVATLRTALNATLAALTGLDKPMA